VSRPTAGSPPGRYGAREPRMDGAREPWTRTPGVDGARERGARTRRPGACGARLRTDPARAPRDRGQAALEYLGMLPFLLLIALAGIQLGIAAYCGSQAATAARTAARTAAESGPDGGTAAAGSAARDAVSGWVNPNIRFDPTDQKVTARASVHIPSVVPGLHLFDPVKRSATMPKEDWTP
jgi:TadE-like protein